MDKEIRAWLHDILMAIDEIDGYFEDRPKLFAEFAGDTRTKRAVERDLEIIGEAVNRILKKDRSFQIVHARNIIGTRNRIAHCYDFVSDELLWSIVINHLPRLRSEIEATIRNQQSPS